MKEEGEEELKRNKMISVYVLLLFLEGILENIEKRGYC
jgi:hypothetical protein